ncbi:MAG TPA: hypothetical protein VM575_02360 [Nocardioides sp.]|nr:hypothetical protein [Nocardioides sp.]
MGNHTAADRTAGLVRVLADAGSLAFGPVGIAAIAPPEAEAFAEMRAAGPGATVHAEWLLAHGSPVAQVYATHLLAAWHPARAAALWTRLATQPGELSVIAGCSIAPTTLAAYAQRELAGLQA